MKIKALSLAGIAVAMSAIPAFAHHSFAMSDAAPKWEIRTVGPTPMPARLPIDLTQQLT